MRCSWLLLGFTTALVAQTSADPAPAAEQPPSKPVLQYTGTPLKIASRCRAEDLSAQGLVCYSDDPCQVLLELSDVEAVGAKLFTAGNLHTPSATIESIVLASEDGGKTWFEPAERVPLATLDKIEFIDFEHGWIGGQAVISLPRDPFFLITTDGGKNWRRRPIYGESRPGAIEYFWFESQTSGKLLIDRGQTGEDGMRHELYETQTGGDTWSLRRVDTKPIEVARPSPPPSGWRIRADARSKSYRIERRQGERWSTVASFLIEAGECKPPEPEAAEPPPAQPEPEAIPAAPPKRPAKPPSLRK